MSGQEQALRCITRLQAGDRAALSMLYDQFTPLLYSVALRILGAATDAEDVVQQLWVQVWRTADRYDPDRGSVGAWLLTQARSRALDRARSRTARRRAEDAAPAPAADATPDPGAQLEAVQRHREVRAALDRLPDRQKEVLELAYFDGLAQSEISERLETPLGTVKSWTRRGLTQLRALMGKEAQS